MTDQPSAADLARDTAVEPVPKVPGHYLAKLPDHWNYVNPSGGVLMTIGLRAMERELSGSVQRGVELPGHASGLQLLSATTVFCQPVAAGDVGIEVVVLRRGDTAAQARARVWSFARPGPGLEVVATFVTEREGPEMHGVKMPEVPKPEASEHASSRSQRAAPFNFYRNVELSLALGAPIWRTSGWQAGPAHAAFWYRYRTPQRDANGELDPLALPPLADTMPPALRCGLGPDVPQMMMPSLDLTVYFLGKTRSEWILVESFSERARAGFAVASANLWSEDGQLVARASQTMTLRTLRR